MGDPRQIAMSILGTIDWQSEVSGFCRCPGEPLHTHKTGKKDCRVCVDGAPTIHCFHSSCAPAVAEANKRLRRQLNAAPWTLVLPGGRLLRNGDVLRSSGEIVRREVVQTLARMEGREAGEQLVLETLKALAERFKPELFEKFRWPLMEIMEASPRQLAECDGDEQFRAWLRIWPAHCHVWIGDVYSSGQPKHRTHFRPVSEWYQIGPVMGNYTCGSAFKAGSFSRSNENCDGVRFLVAESDTLDKNEVGAVFAYMNLRLHFNLHAIIDTAGKSLHGWFDAPRDRRMEERLKVTLKVFGCDQKLFTYSQPVRVPGAYRDGQMQRIVWLKD